MTVSLRTDADLSASIAYPPAFRLVQSCLVPLTLPITANGLETSSAMLSELRTTDSQHLHIRRRSACKSQAIKKVIASSRVPSSSHGTRGGEI